MSNDKNGTMTTQELLDAIDNLRRNINVLNTTVMYLGMAIEPEKLKITIAALQYESTSDKFDKETQQMFHEIAEGLANLKGN